ncbi:Ras-related protein Rab-2A [Hondaea fermentalgiana]|uniref:Ras-related protein Rab-2A n=1 Tax=Hondaea fermentalgiana TaxID=2315210 RepID=A0A2R5GUE7_9STRA|nr:Ras-related protein Rab-2A [Hondaea fermentalgiana]|eukprot:GBG33949.1 Ras-related protein Rab-2A [Hondaea fermentalgiana]
MATPTSFGSSYASSVTGNPIRVSVYLNGTGSGAAGRRVVLDRAESLAENAVRIAHKLKLDLQCPAPKVYTKQGIEVDNVEEIIEGEVLYFEPRGRPFMGTTERSGRGASQSTGANASSNADNNVGASAATRSGRVSGVSPPTAGSNYRTANASNTARSSTRTSFGSTSSVGSTRSRRRRHTPRSAGTASPRELIRGNSFEYNYLFKFILVGSVAVGKSCLLLQFTDQRFRPAHEATIGVDFGTETIRVRNKRVKVQIWDTAGQEYFQSITRTYFREAAAALIVYDVNNRETFNDIKVWLDNVRSSATNRSLVITLVGNKCDKPEVERAVTTEEGETFARENGLLFLETSALSGENVHDVFARTADAVMRKIDAGLIDLSDPSQGVRRGDFAPAVGGTGAGSKSGPSASGPYQLNVNGNRLGNEPDEGGCYC